MGTRGLRFCVLSWVMLPSLVLTHPRHETASGAGFDVEMSHIWTLLHGCTIPLLVVASTALQTCGDSLLHGMLRRPLLL